MNRAGLASLSILFEKHIVWSNTFPCIMLRFSHSRWLLILRWMFLSTFDVVDKHWIAACCINWCSICSCEAADFTEACNLFWYAFLLQMTMKIMTNKRQCFERRFFSYHIAISFASSALEPLLFSWISQCSKETLTDYAGIETWIMYLPSLLFLSQCSTEFPHYVSRDFPAKWRVLLQIEFL